MTEIAHHIDLNLAQKLRNREYRQRFFLAESSAHIAEQLIALRRRRGLDQTQLAEMIGTQQPAISRVEKADYQNWSFNNLRKIADAEDARIRVLIEPAEDILKEYETEAVGHPLRENAELRKENNDLKEENAHLKSALLMWGESFDDTSVFDSGDDQTGIAHIVADGNSLTIADAGTTLKILS
jgi:transcriptional regulator with XRE-family HTH domain